MKPKTSFLILCLLFLFWQIAAHQAQARIDSENISMTVKNANIAELFEMLSRQHHVNILLSKGVEGEVSVNLYNVSIQEAISSIATAGGYLVENNGKEYIIRVPAEAGKTLVGGLKQLKTFKIQYASAIKVAEILKKYVSPYGKVDVLTERQIVVVEDLPEFVRQAEILMNKLDQAPAQILIEAQILDITLDDKRSLGVDWSKTFGDVSVGVKDFATVASGGMFFTLLNKNIKLTLNALSERGKVQVLSTPKLLALEHEDAEVIIGQRTGYQTILETVTGAQRQNIEFLESGVILRVTPNIDRFGGIMMKIHPEVSTTTLNGNIPSLTTTEVTTRVLVQDGQMVFIGGLIKDKASNSHKGIPFLEDIPYLGRLFSSSDETANSTETVVLLKPQIIRPSNMPLITDQKQDVEKFEDIIDKKNQRVEKFFNKQSDLWELPKVTK